jgi:hypothetical protein
LAKEEQVVEGALVHHVEAGFVTVEEVEAIVGSEVGVGGGHARDLAAGRLGLHGLFEHLGLNGPSAAEAPIRRGEFLDHAEFEIVHGFEPGGEHLTEGREVLGGFVTDEDLFGEQTVAHGVERGALFAGLGSGSSGLGGVGAIGAKTFFGELEHRDTSGPERGQGNGREDSRWW